MEASGTITLILGVIFIILGLVFLIINNANRKKTQKALSWPVARGTVTHIEIKEHTSVDDEDGATSTTYEPVVEYTYQVMGQPYTSRRIAYGASQFDKNTAHQKMVQYPQGKVVEVRYNPDKPAESVLETVVAGGKAFQIVGLIFLLIGVVCVLVGLVL